MSLSFLKTPYYNKKQHFSERGNIPVPILLYVGAEYETDGI